MASTTSESAIATDPFAPVPVPLRNPSVAAGLAWLWPGAGHLYQGRYGKGLLFMACILITYFFGLTIGGGHVVYASFHRPDFRYPYLLQVGVGLPALPALFRTPTTTPYDVRDANRGLPDEPAEDQARQASEGFSSWMAPPAHYDEQKHDQLAHWHDQAGYFFELGTLYTMIAGLLNVLAIYDAYAGPVFMHPNPKKKPSPEEAAKP